MIAGRWTGSYRYDRAKLRTAVGWDKTGFEITFISWRDDAFVGTVVDDVQTGGTAGRGEVVGTVAGDKIAFVKRMPVLTFVAPNGKRVVVTGKPHRPIFYSGTMSADRRSMSGAWRIKLGIGFLRWQPVIHLPLTGTWEMSAAEDIG
jgi:hypothetical protein